jgi:hypothetical protein
MVPVPPLVFATPDIDCQRGSTRRSRWRTPNRSSGRQLCDNVRRCDIAPPLEVAHISRILHHMQIQSAPISSFP